eukprot:TRINITY_DN104_c3_g6_i2.p1 TRINITY_DN104_c3_g6~~TRINITY_DN104_c3_g6_i2.p1  ORF type:complete len:203 (-),score=80.44 TRINITY_DN104_c3_g6_i2:18-626(-)
MSKKQKQNQNSNKVVKASSIFDLVSQLSFYASYHTNKWNILIHFFGVPAILWSSLVLIGALGSIGSITDNYATYLQLNLSLLLVIIYGLYYILLDKVAGSFASILLIVAWATANNFYATAVTPLATALFIHVLSWVAQFIGHGAMEGRKPSLFDNLLQSLVLAPYFVFYETLFFFGYRLNLKKQVDQQVKENLRILNKKSTK